MTAATTVFGALGAPAFGFANDPALGLIFPPKDYPIPPDASPQTVDWDRFIGPAPKHDFDLHRFFQWRLFWDYSGGLPTDLFVHLVTATHTLMNVKMASRVTAMGGIYFWKDREVPDQMSAVVEYPEGFQLTLLRVALQPAGIVADPPRAASSAWTAPLYDSAEDAARARHPIYASQQEASAGAAVAGELLPERHALEQAGYEVSVSVRFGDPTTAILATATEVQASLIAMATHGRTGLSHLLLGSVAERVLHRARVPVLLVRPNGIAEFSS